MNLVAQVTRKVRGNAWIALVVMACCTTVSEAAKKPGKDRLMDALNLLEQAKDASEPIPMLREAKNIVEGTLIPHKDAERDKAIKGIGDAIDVALAKGNPKKAIASAIGNVHALTGTSSKKKK
jgi:hypothetical protein